MIIDRNTGECITIEVKGCRPVNVVPTAREVHRRVVSVPYGESRTQQAAKDQTDINNIVNRYTRSGVLPETRQGIYADVRHLQGDRLEAMANATTTLETAENYLESQRRKRSAGEPTSVPAANAASQTNQNVNNETLKQ